MNIAVKDFDYILKNFNKQWGSQILIVLLYFSVNRKAESKRQKYA